MNKLEKLLGSKGFICKKIYVIDGMCVYIEILDLTSSEVFMLYISSKYDIPVDKRDNVYQVTYIDVDDNGNVVGDFAGEPDDHDLEDVYNPGDIEINNEKSGKKQMKEFLEEKYDQPLSLRDTSKNDIKDIRETFRHLTRLKLAVKNIKYKLCIGFKNYLCCIRRDDTLEGFVIKNLHDTYDRKLYVKLELDCLYENINTLSVDIKTVRDGIYNMLNKNHSRHMVNLEKLVLNAANASVLGTSVLQKKERLCGYLNKLENNMSILVQAEKNIIAKLGEIRERYANDGFSVKSQQNDLTRSHLIAKYETELSDLQKTKQEIIKNILIVKTKHENLLLRTDKIFFDNIVMIDEVIKNIITMENL